MSSELMPSSVARGMSHCGIPLLYKRRTKAHEEERTGSRMCLKADLIRFQPPVRRASNVSTEREEEAREALS